MPPTSPTAPHRPGVATRGLALIPAACAIMPIAGSRGSARASRPPAPKVKIATQHSYLPNEEALISRRG